MENEKSQGYCNKVGTWIYKTPNGVTHPCDMFSSCSECIGDSQ